MKFWNRKQTKCISFEGTEEEVKLGTLHSNNLINFDGKSEVIHNKNVHDHIEKNS